MPPPPAGERLTGVQTAFLVLAVLACRLVAVQACPTYDDAFITFRYAANLAAGHGLVFNPGEAWEPVLGTTTLLYALVLSGFAFLGLDLVQASLGFNLACDAVTALVLMRLVGGRRTAATFAVLGFAALPQLARISVGGMESPLFAACALGACLAFQGGRPLLAGILAAATCVVRPEGALLGGLLFVALARRPRELVRYTVPVVVVGLVAAGALTVVYGTPIPQSVLAKSAMQGENVAAEKLARLWTILAQSFLPSVYYLPALPLVAWGLIQALRAPGALRMASLFALGITASYLAARPHTWGWYYYLAHTLWIVWLALGAEHAWSWIERRFAPALRDGLRRFGPQTASAAIAVAAGLAASRAPTPIPDRVYEPLWAWAERTSRAEPGARILASDIGAIAYRWQGTVLDSEGLTWPEALAFRHPLAIIEARAPEYLMVVAERPRLRHLSARPDVMARYEPIARFNVRGDTRLDLAPEDVPLDWSQDYLIYRRRAP